jgi:hypothetical protein
MLAIDLPFALSERLEAFDFFLSFSLAAPERALVPASAAFPAPFNWLSLPESRAPRDKKLYPITPV